MSRRPIDSAKSACPAGALIAGVALALLAAPALARSIDYSIDLQAIQAAADDQGIEGPFSPDPSRGARNLGLVTAPAVDHVMKNVSIYCEAYKVDNPISVLMRKLVTEYDDDGVLAEADTTDADVTLHLTKAVSLHRCLGESDFKTFCKNRTSLSGHVAFRGKNGSLQSAPIAVQVERAGRVGMFCGNLGRFTGIVSREAGIAFLAEATRLSEALENASGTQNVAAGSPASIPQD